MCTHVNTSVTKWCIVGCGLVHCGICGIGLQHYFIGIGIAVVTMTLVIFKEMGNGDWSYWYADYVWVVILCHLSKYKYGSRIPGPKRILGQVTQFWQDILNLYYSTGSQDCFNTIVQLSEICVRGRLWVAIESSDLWSGVPHTTQNYQSYYYWCIHRHSAEMRF